MINIPNHIAFIMDGNGRWAAKRMLPRNVGHRRGVKALEEVADACAALGIKVMTVYAFSTENWTRPKEEVEGLMKIINEFCSRADELAQNRDISIRFLGDLSVFDDRLRAAAEDVTSRTAGNGGMTLCIALNYGGRDDIVQAAAKAAKQGKVDRKSVEANLYTAGLPDVDLVVRTGGEKRLSNFLLYQAAYAELIFTDKLWPDYNKKDVAEAVNEFAGRNRKFGGL